MFMKKPLKIFENVYNSLEALPNEVWCYWWDSILLYHFEGVEPEFGEENVYEKAFWASIKEQLKLGNEDGRSRTSAINGAKSHGRPRNNEDEAF